MNLDDFGKRANTNAVEDRPASVFFKVPGIRKCSSLLEK